LGFDKRRVFIMDKPVLVILAAGMGSRYGGLKQMDPVDDRGHKIIDFSIYDAKSAGFEKVIFIIKKEMAEDFKKYVGDAVSRHMEVEYVFQDIKDVPADFNIPEGRVKPWGTTHAILRCKDVINGPFMVINADDYYGKQGYKIMYSFLSDTSDDETRYAMVSYELGNTLTEKGSVTRGLCKVDENNMLTDIVEQKNLIKIAEGAAYTDADGKNPVEIDVKTPVSMNMWGFKAGLFDKLEKAMDVFYKETVKDNPLKAECLIPTEVDVIIKKNEATVEVLSSTDKWFGVTYKEDKPYVVESIKALKAAGEYPDILWE